MSGKCIGKQDIEITCDCYRFYIIYFYEGSYSQTPQSLLGNSDCGGLYSKPLELTLLPSKVDSNSEPEPDH